MSFAESFSPTYARARARFLAAASAAGARVESHPLALRGPEQEVLAVDVAQLGDPDAERVLVISSGLHGVEGYLGSALQTQLLESRAELPAGTRLLLLHALNPYGMAWIRRFDQHNVDLNRNFLLPGERYEGAPPGYELVHELLNPRRRPHRLSAFMARAALKIARHGFATLKAAVAGGQYEHPRGLFFGGQRPAPTHTLLRGELPRLLKGAARVVHLDVHTGLGERGDYALLLDCGPADPRVARYGPAFAHKVEAWDAGGTAYPVRGGLGPWCEDVMPQVAYLFLTAEFGTVSPLQVIEALHLENRAHHWGVPTSPATQRAKARMRAAFAPEDPAWQETCLGKLRAVVDQAWAVLDAGARLPLARA